MQCQPVWRDWAVGDGDWVWNGAGQLQGIWTGLMDPFETRRGREQRGSPQGHVCSGPSRACRMPFRFSPDRASAAPHLDAIGVRRWGNLLVRLLGKLAVIIGTAYASNLTKKFTWSKWPSVLLTVRFFQRASRWHIYSNMHTGLRLLLQLALRFIFRPRHISLNLGQLFECSPAVNKSSKASLGKRTECATEGRRKVRSLACDNPAAAESLAPLINETSRTETTGLWLQA